MATSKTSPPASPINSPASCLQRTPLAGTEIAVSGLGVGTGQIGGGRIRCTDQQAVQRLRAAYDLGLRYFDVSPLYGHGRAELRLGTMLRDLNTDDYVLSSKVGRILTPAPGATLQPSRQVHPLSFNFRFDYSYDGTLRSFEDSLQRLGLARLDMLFIHDLSLNWHGENLSQRMDEASKGAYRALDTLRRDGVITAIGIGSNDADVCVEMAERGDYDCFMVAGRNTLLDQTAFDHLFPLCQKRGISILAAAPFNNGILAEGVKDNTHVAGAPPNPQLVQRFKDIKALCNDHDVSLIAVALQLAACHPSVVSVVAGFTETSHLVSNMEMMQVPLGTGIWQRLHAVGMISDAACTAVLSAASDGDKSKGSH